MYHYATFLYVQILTKLTYKTKIFAACKCIALVIEANPYETFCNINSSNFSEALVRAGIIRTLSENVLFNDRLHLCTAAAFCYYEWIDDKTV